MTGTPIRVGLADDQPLVRSGVRMILEGEPDIVIVGEAADGAQAVALVADEAPDVLLLDVQMPGTDGLWAMAQIAESATTTRVVMLTTFDLDEYVYEAMRAGASGFLLKDMSGEDIATAVRQVARGADALLAPAVTRRLVDRYTTTTPHPPAGRLEELTPRELEVLTLVARGLSNAEIATELFIGETTVKTHVARILLKLGLRDRVQAVIVAYESRLMSDRP